MNLTGNQTKDFIRLVTEHQPGMFYFILSMVPNRVDAEEILQDTHLFLWEHFAEFTPGSNFRAWAFRIAYHRVLRFFEQQNRARRLFSDEFLAHLADSTIPSPATASLQQEALDDCLKKLKPRDRSLLDARYRPGATVTEIAHEFARNVDAVYRALRRIHEALFHCVRQTLAAEDDS